MNINELLKNKHIKLTSARITLLDILKEAKRPLSYEDIKTNLAMDKATFYRNIAKFEEEGIVNSFESNDKKRYFELRMTPHAHFVCAVCNAIECLSGIDLKIDGYTINNVIVHGKCKKCSLKNL